MSSEGDAKQCVLEMRRILLKGGFRLTKWVSNSPDVLKSVPGEELAPDVCDLDLNQDQLPIQRALGVQWHPADDSLGVKVKKKENPMNRRGLLSTLSSLYDPLGLVAPVILQAKKIFQSECRTKKTWDEALDPANEDKWKKWLDSISLLEGLKWDRCMLPAEFATSTIQLHLFCDALQEAYSCVCYLRAVNADGKIHCVFVMAKSRLAPMRAMTIPRLELQAAVLAVKLEAKLKQELRLELENSVFWTDSTTVLKYIRNTNKRFQTFVANRLTVIHDATQDNQWRYVDSKSNPADDVSRGLSPQQMLSRTRWIHGPDFLLKDDYSWPVCPDSVSSELVNDCEVKGSCAVTEVQQDDIMEKFLERYSSWFRLKKAVAWLRRFVQFVAKKEVSKTPLQVSELQEAEVVIVKLVQKQSYRQELRDLTHKKVVSKHSSIYSLEPTKDDDGVLRVGGRLVHSSIATDAKHPMILPRDHHVSELIVRHTHVHLAGHSGREFVLSVLRQRFWIPKVRPVINRVQRMCVLCK